jgi:hypothetical protein
MQTCVDHVQRAKLDSKFEPNITGAGAAWFRFAYDLYTITDYSILTEALRRKLLDPRTSQSARHELRVAAICAVARFDLQYEDETDTKRKLPEFVGDDRFSRTQIAVEAKSRHRRGVQGFIGGLDELPGGRTNIRDMVIEGYRKEAMGFLCNCSWKRICLLVPPMKILRGG